MVVEVEGQPDERGMVLDFKVIKNLLQPLVKSWDHAIIVSHDDEELLGIAEKTGWKHFILPFDTTAENLVSYVADYLQSEGAALLRDRAIKRFRIQLAETETCYAETMRELT